jgi:hypothetical protein
MAKELLRTNPPQQSLKIRLMRYGGRKLYL